MDALLYARAQMGLSLAFHMIFAATGIALPALMVVSDVLHWRTGDADYRTLSQRLAKGTGILFAVGAVSGTVLSFELGLLWPHFMERFGAVIGLPFALEGFAFFLEAIFLGIYLYGRERVSPRMHLFSGCAVALSGAASAFFVTLVNAFMNNPGGVTRVDGRLDIDPAGALFSPSWATQVPHVLVSCYQATAFAMAGIHAFMLLRQPASTFHRKALGVALAMACFTALVQPVLGDFAAKHIAEHQPAKLAAAEGQFETETHAPLRLFGWPDTEQQRTTHALEIPGALSFLAHGDPAAEVRGLREFPRDEWPPVLATHLSFQVMVGAGIVMALLAALLVAGWFRHKYWARSRAHLLAIVLVSPLGFIALEAGWLVTEWGRQPWVVRGLLRTSDAVTPFAPLWPLFITFTVVYLLLGLIVVFLMVQLVRTPEAPRGADDRLEGGHA